MKKLLRIMPLIPLLWMGSSALVHAAEDVTSTVHNLSSTQPDKVNNISTEATADVCVFCHSPHTEAGGPAPLWNRGVTAGGYTPYTSPTMDMTIGAPAGISMACLTCHDGTVGFDQLINGAGSGGYVVAGGDQGWTFNLNSVPVGDTMPGASISNLGLVLTGDHPISVTYDPTLDTAFEAAVDVNLVLQLYGVGADQVECASCHNPHEADNPTFLRVTTNLCTTCHIK